MNLDISNFLPKYPNIRQIEEEIFDPYSDDFYEVMYRKKEFYDIRLEPTEELVQEPGILTKHQKLISRFLSSHTLYDELLLVAEMGCVSPETPILKWNGSVSRADEISEGDILIGDDGTPRQVINLIEGYSEMFRVEQYKADSYVVNGDHVLTLKISGNYSIMWTETTQTWSLRWFDKKELRARAKSIKCTNISKEDGYEYIKDYRDSIKDDDDILEITVRDYISMNKTVKSYLKGYKCPGVKWEKRDVKIDPYILGMWLGDGNSRGDGFTTNDPELLEYWNLWAEKNNCIIKYVKDSNISFYVRKNIKDQSFFKDMLREYDLVNNKHIPIEFIVNDRDTRLKLLAGIIDTNGYVYNNGTCIEIIQKNKVLSEQLSYLVRSLGYSCIVKERNKSCTYKNQKREGLYYLLSISGNNMEDIPVLLSRKKICTRNQIKDPLVTQITVKSVGEGKYVGWELDCMSNKRFLLGDFTVTHNTGKTCTAVGAIEQIRSEGGGFRGAFYLAKGDALLNNFINELIFKCTDGRYIPDEYKKLTELEKVRRKKKSISSYYTMNTFETFAKEISKSSDEILQKRYNNMVIVIDEVHNLRIQKKEDGLNTYTQFWRFLHVVKDCKILLMSGTPMKDSVDEIASVMNLILPVNEQLPTENDFLDAYFTKENYGGEEVYRVQDDMTDELKEIFKGRVSYLKAMQSEVSKVFVGERSGSLQHFKVVEDFMSNLQSTSYVEAYRIDQEERKGVYTNSRQAALFVFPDGSYGKKGFDKYVRKTKSGSMMGDDGKRRSIFTFSLEPELRNAIRADTVDKMLKNLSMFSSKYAASVQTILQSQRENKLVFVYNEFVGGSGLVLFGAILELFGFSKASGNEPEGNEKPRYASITSETASTKQIRSLVNRYNQPDNMYGKVINVIMGSRKIAEGFSLLNVQVEDIHTPWFNYSEIAQAEARGYRLGSHRMLLEMGIVPQVSIYQRVSTSSLLVEQTSIDLYMYEISESKDISIKGVERLLKESAWDCSLTYNRNHIIGQDGERECDYMDCDYVCDGVPPEMIEEGVTNADLDYSTFQLYYYQPNVKKIIEQLILIFRYNFSLDLQTILSLIDYSTFEVVTALRTMINDSVEIMNKYGYPSYLQEDNDIFFLVNSLSVIGNFSSDYYTQFPHVKPLTNYRNIIEPIYVKSLPEIVDTICKSQTEEEMRNGMARLPKIAREFFIEGSILARKMGVTKNVKIRDLILKYFESYYDEFDGMWLSWYLFEDENVIRCLKGNTWEDCGEEYKEKIDARRRSQRQKLETNPYGFYGQIDRINNIFSIRDVSQPIPTKGQQIKSGKVCSTWTLKPLFDLVLDRFNMQVPPEDKMEVSEQKLWSAIKKYSPERIWAELAKKVKFVKNRYGSVDNFPSKPPKNMSIDELRRLLFWASQDKDVLCRYLQQWFESKGLLIDDPDAGKSTRRRAQ